MIHAVIRLLVLLSVTLPLTSCSSKSNPKLVGLWEINDKGKRCSLEFTKDGKVLATGDTTMLKDFQFIPKMLIEFNLQTGAKAITYRSVNDKELEITGDFSAMVEKLAAGGSGPIDPEKVKELHTQEKLNYTVNDKELTLTNSQGSLLKLKRFE